MSFGKNPKNFSKGRKGAKKKVGDRFLKKEWWDIKAPGMFSNRKFTKSPVNVSAGKKLSSETIKGRVFECNLGDLNGNNAYKKIKLIIDDTSSSENRTALTNFHGIDTTKDHLCSLIRKWHTLIETFVDVKTSDGFLLRFFPIAFTARSKHQLRATTYAQDSQVRLIRQKMRDIISKFVRRNSLKEVVNNLIHEKLAVEMTHEAKKIFPIQNCLIRKVKTLKRPRYDVSQLLSMHVDVTPTPVAQTEQTN